MTAVDLDAYLARIRLPARPTLDAAGLARLQRAHRLAIPFENLDVGSAAPIAIDSAAVFAKLVTAQPRRLLLRAEPAVRSTRWPRSASPRGRSSRASGSARRDVPPLTHTLSLVDARRAGLDRRSRASAAATRPPMPLVDGAEADAPDGARFRLRREPRTAGCCCATAIRDHRRRAAGGDGLAAAIQLHADDRARRRPRDGQPLVRDRAGAAASRQHRIAQHRPAARLRDAHRPPLPPPGRGTSETEGEITDPRVYRMRLSLMFGIDLSEDEVAALGLFS